jgi:hypothetical protein
MLTFFYRSVFCLMLASFLAFPSKMAYAAMADNGEAMPLPVRLAFMRGHVEAGMALYRLDEFKMAAPHLLHPVSETHMSERVGLKDLGFDEATFVLISAALDAGKTAKELSPILIQAEANLAMIAAKAGGSHYEIVQFLLKTITEEYTIAVSEGTITDIGEYQDAFGFRLVASDHAQYLSAAAGAWLVEDLENLGSLWVNGPLPTDSPTSAKLIRDTVNDIAKKLKAQLLVK